MCWFCTLYRSRRTISFLHVDFECFKLALWPTLRQKLMNFWSFLTRPGDKHDEKISNCFLTPKLVQVHNSAMSLTFFFNFPHDKTPNLMVFSEISFWNEMFLCSIKKDCCWIVTDSPHVKAENRKQCTTPSARDFATVLSDSPGLRDFAIGLVLNLPDGQVLFWGGNSNYRRTVINPANQKGFWG